MTSEPLAPGAPALILYREVNRNDMGRSGRGGMTLEGGTADRYEEDYFRIKILTEQGRHYANVEVRLSNEIGSVVGINGRTIHPDGSIVNFDGKSFEQTISKSRGFQYRAEMFALPDVTVGSVIEYYYTITFREGYIYSSQWILSNELFTKKARFTLRPYHNDYVPMNFRWTEHLLQGVSSPREINDGLIQLDANNIPAFHTEDFMPPENELEARVDFIYSLDAFESDPAKFWKKVGKRRNEELETFIAKRGALQQAMSQIISPTDSPEAKLRKIYARVQQLRNTSYESRKSEQEQKRENHKTEANVEDVWKQGYGDRKQLNWLFVALARAAGVEAYGVWISDRRNYFFDPRTMQSGKLDQTVVLVKLDGKDLYVEPGTPFAPFGVLPWEETGVPGLQLDRDGGSWIRTSMPESSVSRIERKAELRLSPDGTLTGTVSFAYLGLEALRRRLDQINGDDAARKKFLEDEAKSSIPIGSEVELTSQPDWKNSEAPLTAAFHVNIPGWLALAGHRGVFPVGILSATEKHVFEYSDRVQPIYYEYKSQKLDDITVELPSGWQISALPKSQDQDLHVVEYAFSAEGKSSTLHLSRKFEINAILIDAKYYGALRTFYQIVKGGDEQAAILSPVTTASRN